MLKKFTLIRFCGFLCAVLGYIGCIGDSSCSSAEVQSILEVLTTAPPGTHAIPLKVWSEKKQGQGVHNRDRIVIAFQAARPAYLMILACASNGEVTILFPNKEHPGNFIEQDKPYTLFGDDSALRLSVGRECQHCRLILCATAKPFSFNALKDMGHEQWVTIPVSAHEQIETLKSTILSMSKEQDFNRILMPVPGAKGDNHELIVSVSPDQGWKGLPAAVGSTEPEVVTGAAGLKPVKQGSKH